MTLDNLVTARTTFAPWRQVFGDSSRAECLAYVEEHWADIRPKSLREAMDARCPIATVDTTPAGTQLMALWRWSDSLCTVAEIDSVVELCERSVDAAMAVDPGAYTNESG